jgi:hypothetical protein
MQTIRLVLAQRIREAAAIRLVLAQRIREAAAQALTPVQMLVSLSVQMLVSLSAAAAGRHLPLAPTRSRWQMVIGAGQRLVDEQDMWRPQVAAPPYPVAPRLQLCRRQ